MITLVQLEESIKPMSKNDPIASLRLAQTQLVGKMVSHIQVANYFAMLVLLLSSILLVCTSYMTTQYAPQMNFWEVSGLTVAGISSALLMCLSLFYLVTSADLQH